MLAAVALSAAVEGRGWWVVVAEDGAVSSLYPHCIPTESSLYPHCIPPKRGVCGGKEEGGRGKMRMRSKEEEEGRIGKRRKMRKNASITITILTVSPLYPHCIPPTRGGRRWVETAAVEGGG